MSLKRALERLPGDRATECAVREVLQLFRIHPGEWLTADEVARRLESPESLVSGILAQLSDGFVLGAEGDRYAYERDSYTDMEIDRFLKRVDTHTGLVQSNVAKFRERYGYR
jgi:hypothetical protein